MTYRLSTLITLILICIASTSLEAYDIKVVNVKKKFLEATDLNEKEKLLRNIIESYTQINLDSALYYSDIYRKEFIDVDNPITECNYFSLLSSIYKKQHNLILYQEQANRAMECYKSIDSKENTAKAHLELGIAFGYQGKIAEAKTSFEEAKDIFLEIPDSLMAAECSMHLGTTNIMKGERVEGLASYQEVLAYYEKIGYEDELSKLCNNIGLVHKDLYKNAEALHYFQKALAYAEKTEDKFIATQVLANIASCYTGNSEYNIALGYLDKGLLLSEEIESQYSKAIFYYEVASAKNKLGRNYEALDAINNSLVIVKEMNNVDQIARGLVKKSEILLALSNYSQAHNACKECYEISKRTQTLKIQKIALDCITKTANSLKIYKEAFEYQQEYIAVSDSLKVINDADKFAILEKETNYQREKAVLEQKNLLNEALLREEKNNTKIFALLSTLSLLGFALLGFIFMSNKRYTSRIKEKTVIIKKSNEELNKVNKDLENANTKLNNFTSVAAHDLKSPLRTMASYSQLLLMRNKGKFEEKDAEMLAFVSDNARRLTSMIDDLLTFSKINEDLGPTETIKTNDVVNVVLKNLESVIQEQKAQVNVIGNLGTVQAHTNLLTQLFQNLIANGIKFKQEHKLPAITIAKHAETEETMTYMVADNGIGISKEYHDKIFTIFQRLHKADDFEGSGIGLSTCKSIVDYYDQDIWLESEVNKGTKFFFTLPKN